MLHTSMFFGVNFWRQETKIKVSTALTITNSLLSKPIWCRFKKIFLVPKEIHFDAWLFYFIIYILFYSLLFNKFKYIDNMLNASITTLFNSSTHFLFLDIKLCI